MFEFHRPGYWEGVYQEYLEKFSGIHPSGVAPGIGAVWMEEGDPGNPEDNGFPIASFRPGLACTSTPRFRTVWTWSA
jgi:hypothetical protein